MSRPQIPLDRRGIHALAGVPIFWTPARLAVLDERYNRPGETNKAIARDLGCTLNALRCAAVKRGLTRNRRNPGLWTDGELELLRRFYGVIPSAPLARQLGRTRNALHRKATDLGLSYLSNAQAVALQQMRLVRELRVLLALHIRPINYITDEEAWAVLNVTPRQCHQLAVRHAAAGSRELDGVRRRQAEA